MEFRHELDRRLAIVEDHDYEDPAKADLPGRDLVLLLIAGALIISAMFWWGYPW
ncbi:MAG: hypothetical protein ACRDQW_09350 [Haloechinothrix sp.]